MVRAMRGRKVVNKKNAKEPMNISWQNITVDALTKSNYVRWQRRVVTRLLTVF